MTWRNDCRRLFNSRFRYISPPCSSGSSLVKSLATPVTRTLAQGGGLQVILAVRWLHSVLPLIVTSQTFYAAVIYSSYARDPDPEAKAKAAKDAWFALEEPEAAKRGPIEVPLVDEFG